MSIKMPKKSLMRKLCATCLSFTNFEFPVTEDTKGVLRSLLYDFGFDEFIQAIPPHKQLTLCDMCNQMLLDMVGFKERARRSFNEFKKYWCVNMSKQTTLYTVAAPSSSIIENVTSCDDIKIEDPKELKCEEPDLLEITKTDSESIHNIYDSFIDIKEEIDPSTLNQTEPIITNNTLAHKNKNFNQNCVNNKEETPRNDNFNHNYANNNEAQRNAIFNHYFVTTQNNINHNIGSVVLNNAATIDISVNNCINSQVAAKTVDSINHNFVNCNVAVPSNNQFNQNYVPIVSNMVPVSRNEIFNQNYVNNQIPESRNGSINQNIAPKVTITSNVPPDNNFNLNITTDNSYICNAAADSNDLENTTLSSLLIKCANVLPVINDIEMLNNFNSRITNNPHRNNIGIATNSRDQNIKIVKGVRMDNGQVVIGDENKKIKIVIIDNRGNIENVGEGIMCNPVPVSKDNDLVAPSCESANSSTPNTREDNTQNVIDGGAISASDSESEGEFTCDDEDKIKKNGEIVGMAVKSHERTEDKGQKKWYIKIVTREEILKKMEESRNRPDFLEAPHKCVSCVALFRDEWLAAFHRKECHTEDSEFTCFACFHTFKTFHFLKAHYYGHIIDKCVYHCITCEFETRDIKYIKCHICPNAGSKLLPPKDPNTMKISNSRSLYYCHKCEYVSTRSSVLTTHYDTKHKNKVPSRIKCDDCGKFYAGKYTLRLHKGTVHGGKKLQEEPVFCNLCNKWFSSKITHYSHLKNIHRLQEELRFPCDECETKFFTAKGLEKHKELHANVKEVKKHEFNECGNAFYTKNALRSHKVARHGNKPTIRNHECEVCGMAFYAKTTLQNHMARHSNPRPYKCGVCGDTFKYSAAMRTHTKLKHTKKKNSDQSHQKYKGQEKKKKGS